METEVFTKKYIRHFPLCRRELHSNGLETEDISLIGNLFTVLGFLHMTSTDRHSETDSPFEENSLPSRIIETARKQILAEGFTALRMEDLAAALGISKKTIYVHFPGKEAILGTIIDSVGRLLRARLEAITKDPNLTTAEKICAAADAIGNATSRLTPDRLHDLKRNAPALFRKVENIRRRNIPMILGRLIQLGIADGSIRSDIDPDFVCEFWFHAIRGMTDPETMDRTQLTQKQTFAKSVDLFFNGILTADGRKNYQKSIGQHLDKLAARQS